MKRSRFTQKQIIGVLNEHQAGATAADQSCTRQEGDFVAFAEWAGYEVVGTYRETASGIKARPGGAPHNTTGNCHYNDMVS